jgi:ElaB/YqjD/DUF883 family membrane-anchored ribosome-binding protein
VDSELEVIRDQMHQTRASLADKLDALESQVRDTVQTATEAVTTTAETVKGVTETVTSTVEGVTNTVTDTVQSVAEKLDITQYVERAPWLSFGAAVASGFAAGYMLGGPAREKREAWRREEPFPLRATQEPERPEEEGLFAGVSSLVSDGLQEGVQTALTGLQGLAVGAVMGLVRDWVQTSVSGSMQQEIVQLVDRVSTRLGGKPLDFGRRGDSSAARGEDQGEANTSESLPLQQGREQTSQQGKRQERRRAANGRR